MTEMPVIAIFDIGKTNKKFFLISESYHIVLERSEPFAEIKDEDGDACDDVNLLTNWVVNTLAEVLQLKKFVIKAVNFSAYGASFVYVGEKGNAIAPLYSYLKTYPEKIKNQLYDQYGGEDRISCETASPVLGSLNSGMQLYRTKVENPSLYSRIKYALHLPQYISFLVSRKPFSDITSIGCHTQLWDYRKNEYHQWVKEEGIDVKLAPVIASDITNPILFREKTLEVGTGLHDSSAALIPYLAVFSEPFVLISTGTWCISLNPFNNNPLTTGELKQDCLCYMEYHGKPVKASRLFTGHEHELQVKKISVHFEKPEDYYKKVKYNAALIAAWSKAMKPGGLWDNKEIYTQHSGMNLENLSSFKNFEEAYHFLMLKLVRQQAVSTGLVIQRTNVNRIFVDGGFSNNSIYMHLLALVFPELEVYAASVAQATAIGAALAIHKQWNKFPVPADMVKLKFYRITDTVKFKT